MGAFPSKGNIYCSGNIIKNAKSVIVPNTGGLKGIEVSDLAGIVGGKADRKMEVLAHLDKRHSSKVAELLEMGLCQVFLLDSEKSLHIIIEVLANKDLVTVEIQDFHSNIVKIEKMDK